MTTTLFADDDVTHASDDPGVRRATRRLALGGALQLIRARQGWNVNEAASRASIAPMTWRRLEDGMPVRERSHAALDQILGLPFGTVKRALNDDLLMVEIVKLAGIDTRHVVAHNAFEFLQGFGEQTRTDSPRQVRAAAVGQARMQMPPAAPVAWPAIDEATRRALEAVSLHVPTVKPTDLELVNRVVEQLTRTTTQTPAIRELIQAAARAVPDLIAQQLAEAERDLARDAGERAADRGESVDR